MDKPAVEEILRIVEALTKECQILARRANAMDNLLHDKTPYGLAYDHALGRAPESKVLQELLGSISILQESLTPKAPPNRSGFQSEVKS